jgi:hypothetical protein
LLGISSAALQLGAWPETAPDGVAAVWRLTAQDLALDFNEVLLAPGTMNLRLPLDAMQPWTLQAESMDIATLARVAASLPLPDSGKQALRELDEMKTTLAELLNQGYRPDMNDGVMVTAAPLWQFFRYTPWRNNLRACWKELARGDYDWSHLAMFMWPDRVLEICKKDRSIAIAHGKEELCPAAPVKGTRGRQKATD